MKQSDMFPEIRHITPADQPRMICTPYGMASKGGIIHKTWLKMEELEIENPTEQQWTAAMKEFETPCNPA